MFYRRNKLLNYILVGFSLLTSEILLQASSKEFEIIGEGNCFYKTNVDHWCDFSREATLRGNVGVLSQHFQVSLNINEDPEQEDFQVRHGKFVAANGTMIILRDRISAGRPPYPQDRFDHQHYEGVGYIIEYSVGKAPGKKLTYTTVLTIDEVFDLRPMTWRQSETRTFADGKIENNSFLFLGGDPRDDEDSENGNISFFQLAKGPGAITRF